MGRRSTSCWALTWPHASGVRLGLARLGIDTGYEAPAVYAWARRHGAGQVVPLKGVDGFNRAAPIVGPTYVDASEGGKRIRRGARLWTVAVATFKSETYRFLRHDRPTDEAIAAGAGFPAGYLHLPQGTDAEWTKQLVAEQLVTVKTRRGFTKLEWQKLRERNEALDCRVYARAAAWIAGADRWSEAKWAELEKQLGAGVVSRGGRARCRPRLTRRRSPAACSARRGAATACSARAISPDLECCR